MTQETLRTSENYQVTEYALNIFEVLPLCPDDGFAFFEQKAVQGNVQTEGSKEMTALSDYTKIIRISWGEIE